MATTGTYNPAEATGLDGDNPLKVSKSSFGLVNKCARQYWWQKIGLADVNIPPNEVMIRGSEIHSGYEHLFTTWKGQTTIPELLDLMDGCEDGNSAEHWDAYTALAELESARINAWGDASFAPIMFEDKLHYDCTELGVRLVGVPDAVLLKADGSIVIVELKTGSWNDGKMSRTRRELAFYCHMLTKLGYITDETPNIYFMYVAPDCDNYEYLQKLEGSKRKEVWSGSAMGITIVEKMNQRSYNTMLKHLEKAVNTLKTQTWDMSWDDFYCPQYCDFYNSCDAEMQGDAEPPMNNPLPEAEEAWDS